MSRAAAAVQGGRERAVGEMTRSARQFDGCILAKESGRGRTRRTQRKHGEADGEGRICGMQCAKDQLRGLLDGSAAC